MRKNLTEKIQRLVTGLGSLEKWALVTTALVGAALYAFVELAGEITEQDTHALDRAILLALRTPTNPSDPLGPLWMEEMMRDFTALGGIAILGVLTLAVIGFFILRGMRNVALIVAGSVIGGVILSSVLKWGFDRTRPDLVPHGSIVYTQSFPSGHAMLSAVVYLTLGVLLARTQQDLRVKIYFLGVAMLATVLVGISRIYLGVHWPTDVLAGWIIGAAWALLSLLVMLWMQRNGKLEVKTPSSNQKHTP